MGTDAVPALFGLVVPLRPGRHIERSVLNACLILDEFACFTVVSRQQSTGLRARASAGLDRDAAIDDAVRHRRTARPRGPRLGGTAYWRGLDGLWFTLAMCMVGPACWEELIRLCLTFRRIQAPLDRRPDTWRPCCCFPRAGLAWRADLEVLCALGIGLVPSCATGAASAASSIIDVRAVRDDEGVLDALS